MDGDDARLAFAGTHSGGESAGIYGCRLDGTTGDLSLLGATATAPNPTYLAASDDGARLYAACESDRGRVVTFAVDREAGRLAERHRARTGDAGPAHCALDPRGEFLFVAHYRGGSVATLPLDDAGRAGAPTQVVAHEGSSVDPDRQGAPHPHAATPDPTGEVVYVPDLGTDEVVVYGLDRAAGTLSRRETVSVSAGAGPRHVGCHPDGTHRYLVNELDSTLATLRRGPDGHAVVDVVDTTPPAFDGENYPAGVAVHSSGDWLYVTNRGHDSVAVFDLADPGSPRPRDHVPAGGAFPRALSLDPAGEHLLVAAQESGAVTGFDVDPATGALGPTGAAVDVPDATAVAFVPPG
jgi:6-phosphogluconolactonase